MGLLIKIVQDYIIRVFSTSFYYCFLMTLYQLTNSYAVHWNTVHFRTSRTGQFHHTILKVWQCLC